MIEKGEPPGPLLLLDEQFSSNAPDAPISIDWIHSKIPLMSQIGSKADFLTFRIKRFKKN